MNDVASLGAGLQGFGCMHLGCQGMRGQDGQGLRANCACAQSVIMSFDLLWS